MSPRLKKVDETKDENKEEKTNVEQNNETFLNEVVKNANTSEDDKFPSEREIEVSKRLYEDVVSFLTRTVGINKDDESKIKRVIPTGISLLDIILGGGIGTKVVQLVGMPGGGKSALAAKILATAQKKWGDKFFGIYLDSEQGMSKERLMRLGVKYPPIEPFTEVTVEKVFEIIDSLCVYKEEHPELMDVPFCVVWDSVANTLTDKGNATDKPAEIVGQKANVLSHLLPKYTPKLNKYCISLLCVNQLRERLSIGYTPQVPTLKFLGDNKNIPGGYALAYNSFQIVYLRAKDNLNGDFGFVGSTVYCKTVKNKLFAPNIDIELVLNFDRGFSEFWTNYLLLKKFERIRVGGGWVALEGYSGSKSQVKGLFDKYKSDNKFKEVWDDHVRDVLNNIIEEYKSETYDEDF